MLYLQKNEKNIEANKQLGQDKLPYFSLLVVPEDEQKKLNWDNKVEIGAFWKSKSGKGYIGRFAKGFEYSTVDIKDFKKSSTQNGD